MNASRILLVLIPGLLLAACGNVMPAPPAPQAGARLQPLEQCPSCGTMIAPVAGARVRVDRYWLVNSSGLNTADDLDQSARGIASTIWIGSVAATEEGTGLIHLQVDPAAQEVAFGAEPLPLACVDYSAYALFAKWSSATQVNIYPVRFTPPIRLQEFSYMSTEAYCQAYFGQGWGTLNLQFGADFWGSGQAFWLNVGEGRLVI